MATIAESISYYEAWDWSKSGSEWSHYWGSDTAMWDTSVYPRLKPFLPTETIVEIGCGHGRLSNFLERYSQHQLVLTDIIDSCIQTCRRRFSNNSKVACLKTDGKSLSEIRDNSVDLVVSFYSLVDTDAKTLGDYLSEFDRILKKDGIVFLHHSNSADYFDSSKIENNKNMQLLAAYRDVTVSARKLQKMALQKNLVAISQECINWDIQQILSDCFSLICRPESKWFQLPVVRHNLNFVDEMSTARQQLQSS